MNPHCFTVYFTKCKVRLIVTEWLSQFLDESLSLLVPGEVIRRDLTVSTQFGLTRDERTLLSQALQTRSMLHATDVWNLSTSYDR